MRLCDRHRGIGADGLLILVPSASGKADYAWEFYNSDGSTGEMCGNGARCFSRFVQKRAGLNRDLTFETEAGIIKANFHGNSVTVSLTSPRDLRLAEQVPLSTGPETIHSLNTGVPHAVLFGPTPTRPWWLNSVRKSVTTRTSAREAPALPSSCSARCHPCYTFERGVEGGNRLRHRCSPSSLHASKFGSPSKSGPGRRPAEVSFEKWRRIRQRAFDGTAEFVFEGRIEL